MKKPKLDYKLDAYEKELLRSVEAGEWTSVPNQAKWRRELIEAAKNTLKMRKSKSITLRVEPDILTSLKIKAQKIGMPYQTLISTLLHQYATGKITLTL